MNVSLLNGNCLDILRELPDDSIDSIVTDPPYGLSFMGKKWDYDVPSVEIWKECLRVLKPGGHLLAFGGTRTYHRLAVNVEDAGFEIRDQIQWIYGSGFPKSHNVGKATGDARFEGVGTALKPANEPIVLARKPLIGTVAENVLTHGVGGINVDASRIGLSDNEPYDLTTKVRPNVSSKDEGIFSQGSAVREAGWQPATGGRFPSNVIFDEAAAELLDAQSGILKSNGGGTSKVAIFGGADDVRSIPKGDKGGASRFFYVAKASKKDRGEGNVHPTVKPTTLMEYLVKLVTPPGGIVLDPFMGSGTTGVACSKAGFQFIGCELDESYFQIAETRINGRKTEEIA